MHIGLKNRRFHRSMLRVDRPVRHYGNVPGNNNFKSLEKNGKPLGATTTR